MEDNRLQQKNDALYYVVEKQFGLRNLETDFVDQLIIKGEKNKQ